MTHSERRLVTLGRWLDRPAFRRAALVALGVWASAGFWDITRAIIEQRQGAGTASITAAASRYSNG